MAKKRSKIKLKNQVNAHVNNQKKDFPVKCLSDKPKKQPVIIKFEEPGKRKASFTNMDKEAKSRNSIACNAGKAKTPTAVKEEFQQIAREVRHFGMTGFEYKQRKKFEQQLVEKLGGRKRKENKMPYPLYMKVQKIRKERECNEREIDRAAGNVVTQKSKKQSKSGRDGTTQLATGHWVDRSGSSNPSIGKHKNGVYFIKPGGK